MRDARRLMTAALGVNTDRLTLHLRDDLPEAARRLFHKFCERRVQREPVSRILGGRLFYGRWFKNNPHVLDPRPETEILVELALLRDFETFLDIGTGSGCIAITLLAERRQATALASDISGEALTIAKENAISHAASTRACFVISDWFASIEGHFDLIVSNPPYIHPDEIPDLEPEVRKGDPLIALTDHVDGLTGYREIARGAQNHLSENGRVLVEIGSMQGQQVQNLFEQAGFVDCAIHQDLDGRDRVVEAFAQKT
ncbi:MAG: peptide chain release factor N(5)-glutamine methyltransferase [Boseongicola sp.]|nr:peptide chain release factor N(5)-glutamine methyltransferase [Boseongicola sp.]